MRSIAVDSGPLYALFDNADRYHARATDFLRALDGRLVTNLPVITEVVYLLNFSPEAQRDFLNWVRQAAGIDTGTVSDLPRINALLEKYADLPADFADASLVALCERLKITEVASVDKDFTIYRTRRGSHFNNLFFDA